MNLRLTTYETSSSCEFACNNVMSRPFVKSHKADDIAAKEDDDVANYFKGEVAAGLRVAPANDEYTSVL